MQNHNLNLRKIFIIFPIIICNLFTMLLNIRIFRSVAQLVERRSPKPEVAGSMPATPAKNKIKI